MLLAYKFRIYPNASQEESLAKAFGCTRWLWNRNLAETQRIYKETGKGLSQFDLNNGLLKLKKEFPWLAETHSQILQSVSLHMSRAFINFFERRARYPKFKNKKGKQSIQYPQRVKIIGDKIKLPKIGLVKVVIHREIIGKIKTVTISKVPSGKYFASILTDNGVPTPKVSYKGKIIGIDVGLTHLAITSEGTKFENPRHLLKATKNLKRKQQKLSRKMKGSNSRNKAKILVAKAHEKVVNCRKDYLHKVSRRLVDENQVVAVEDLHVKGMMKNHKLARAISDVGWSTLVEFLRYKTERVGKGFIKVNRFFPSSKACSVCFTIKSDMPLDIRSWRCDRCGTLHDRDVNAAMNIRNEASRMIAAGIAVTAGGGTVSQGRGRKSSVLASARETGNPMMKRRKLLHIG